MQVLFKRKMRDRAILNQFTQSEWSPAVLRRLTRRSEEVNPVSEDPTFLADTSPNQSTGHSESPLICKHQETQVPSPLATARPTCTMNSPLLVKSTSVSPVSMVTPTSSPLQSKSTSPSQFSRSSASPPTPTLEVKSEVSLLMPSLLLEQEKMYKSSTNLDQLASSHSSAKSPLLVVRMRSRHSSSLDNISTTSAHETSTSLDSLWGSTHFLPESRTRELEDTNVRIEIATMDLYALRGNSDLHNHISIALEDHRMVCAYVCVCVCVCVYLPI